MQNISNEEIIKQKLQQLQSISLKDGLLEDLQEFIRTYQELGELLQNYKLELMLNEKLKHISYTLTQAQNTVYTEVNTQKFNKENPPAIHSETSEVNYEQANEPYVEDVINSTMQQPINNIPDLQPGEEILAEVPKTVHENLSSKNKAVDVNSTLRKNIVLDLNDRIYLQRELFNNDSEEMRVFLNALSATESNQEKINMIKKNTTENELWSKNTSAVERLMQIIEK